MRYFVEPVVLTANYALTHLNYTRIYMAGLSGGGWTTTLAPAIDKRIVGSFPIAGSVPCSMRNPSGKVPNQRAGTWDFHLLLIGFQVSRAVSMVL